MDRPCLRADSRSGGEDSAIAKNWLGPFAGRSGTIFQWHGETFSLPTGATRLLANGYCANQMFALGPHLGMQCHVEMTEDMIRQWCRDGAGEIAASTSPAVQSPDAITADIGQRVAALNAVADRIYQRWIEGLQRP